MRAASARIWREILLPYAPIHLYSVDPGAHAMMMEIAPLLRDMARLGSWFAEGWSAKQLSTYRPLRTLEEVRGEGAALLVGSQASFAQTRAVLDRASTRQLATLFVFDHWKNYAAHFAGGALPDVVIVPDELGRESLLACFGEDARSRVRVAPHVAVEAAADRIAGRSAEIDADAIAVLLEPTEPADGLGYDWRSALAAIAEAAAVRPRRRLLVKPHPRQDERAVAEHVAAWRAHGIACEVFSGDVESLLAIAGEVWGITTVALNIALALGKPVRSFQPRRNAAGARVSNPHIEPYVVT